MEREKALSKYLESERRRLVGLCAHLTGETQGAEDLAQETLVLAWQLSPRLRRVEECRPWLSAIARNVCRQWRRRHKRALVTHEPEPLMASHELERSELAVLLDQALALLPANTRQSLLERHVYETPLSELAQSQGLTEGALAVRLHRGRLTLRRALQEDTPTLWCPFCGTHPLTGGIEGGGLRVRCAQCFAGARAHFARTNNLACLGEVTTLRLALDRWMVHCHAYYARGLRRGLVPCPQCAQLTLLKRSTVAGVPALRIDCRHCHYTTWQSELGIAFLQPPVQRFWRAHPRIRLAARETTTLQGRSAFHARFESCLGRATVDVFLDQETLTPLEEAL